MPTKLFSAATIGLDAIPIEVEVDVTHGLFSFAIVGLADKAVGEAKQRVASAIKNFGALAPTRHNLRIVVNLAPADLKKEGSAYDLAIALGFLLATDQIGIKSSAVGQSLFVGELALDGRIRPVPGVLPMAEMASKRGFTHIFVPRENAAEAGFVPNMNTIPVGSLEELVRHLEGREIIPRTKKIPAEDLESELSENLELGDIRGQETAKRVLEIAAAGGHNLLFFGPPGTGKTLLAKSITSILPPLELGEAIEVTKIYSVAGLLEEGAAIIRRRPFRAPHHSASGVAIVGGGSWPKPGEVSLAHRGVLFLDEFPEFSRPVIENLRQPMEEGFVIVSRARGTVRFPAKFILVAAMNPCPCGWYGDPRRECRCTSSQIMNYQKKISGPILDRIDLHYELPRLSYDELTQKSSPGEAAAIRARVAAARRIQEQRFSKLAGAGRKIFTNAEMPLKDLETHCALTPSLHQMLRRAQSAYSLSPRNIHRTLRVARTVADLDGSEKIEENHLGEALQYRAKQDQ